jgi:outer membrane protein insertion porin family
VTVNITEGEQYTVKEFDFMGDLLGREELIGAVIPLKTGKLYNGSVVTASEEFIKNYLARFGYANAEVRTIPEIDDENKEVKLTLSVDPGKRIYVRRINLAGNEITADEVIRREVTQLEGAWLSNNSLERSKIQIQRLMYMETVDFDVIPVPGQEDQVDVDFTVKEQSAGSFNAGLAYGSYNGLQFNIGVSESNFLGTGDQVAFNISTAVGSQNLSISHTDPYFTKDGISLGNSIFFTNFDASQYSLIDYKSKRYGIGSNFGIPVNANNRINFGATISQESLSELSEYEQTRIMKETFSDPNDPEAPFEFLKLELSLGWSRVTLNRGMFPTAGSKQSLTLKATTPNSDLNYFKVNYDSRYYWPISSNHKWVFSAKGAIGYGNGYGSTNGYDQVLPVQEYFRISEIDLRGFERNTILPQAITVRPKVLPGTPDGEGTQGPPIGSDPQFDIVQGGGRIGGNVKAVAGLEMIVPTPFLDDENSGSVRTSFFVDAANVWDTEFDISRYSNLTPDQRALLEDYSDPARFRVSTGLSVQWISPMGPMVISLSYPLKKEDDDDTNPISFNISNTF